MVYTYNKYEITTVESTVLDCPPFPHDLCACWYALYNLSLNAGRAYDLFLTNRIDGSHGMLLSFLGYVIGKGDGILPPNSFVCVCVSPYIYACMCSCTHTHPPMSMYIYLSRLFSPAGVEEESCHEF